MNPSRKPQDIGKKLKHLREKRKLTQAQLAAACDVDPGTFSKMERGKILPKAAMLLKLSRLLRVPADYLLDDSVELPLVPVAVERSEKAGSRVMVSPLERLILRRLRECPPMSRQLIRQFLKAGPEVQLLVYRLAMRDQSNSRFWKYGNF